MDTFRVFQIGTDGHCSQIMAGLELLRQAGEIAVDSSECRYVGGAMVEGCFRDRVVVYDLADGYQLANKLRDLMKGCDFYFKRSYSRDLNRRVFSEEEQSKIFPLGLNYQVAVPGSLFQGQGLRGFRGFVKRLVGWKSDDYFTCDKFEEVPREIDSDKMQILFMTRLWSPDVDDASGERSRRESINAMRIALIRAFRKKYGKRFFGGVQRSRLAYSLAPDCILDYRITNRSNYLNILHGSDICIGSTGLHNSIGWKLAEYVAAAKAIATEPLFYEIPGGFDEGRNYLRFDDVDGAITAVDSLVNDPAAVYRMKLANADYYAHWLRPDALVRNSLERIK